MDKNLAMMLLFAAIMVLLAITFGAEILWSEAKIRGWAEGFRENEHYHRLALDAIKARIDAREHALAMYRDIATTLCDNVADCMYCPYERDKNNHKCVLWELNEKVEHFGIEEVHVDTKYDGDDRDGR